MSAESPILQVSEVEMAFGGVRALGGVSLAVRSGEIVGVIGPNGAGKSTLFSVITGFLRPTSGRVLFKGQDIVALRPEERWSLGLVRTWQIPRPFASMSVSENVLTAAVSQGGALKAARHGVAAVLDELGLAPYARDAAADLPPAFKKRLELARALVRAPRVLLLDEVMAGLTIPETTALVAILRARVERDGLTIVLIEHVIRAVRALCERVVVLAGGRLIAEGPPKAVMEAPAVVEAYLGNAEYLRAASA